MAADKIEAEAIVTGEGEELGEATRCWRSWGSATATPKRDVQHPRRPEAELVTVPAAPSVPRCHQGRHRRLPAGRRPAPPRRRSGPPATPSSDRQQGQRAGHHRPRLGLADAPTGTRPPAPAWVPAHQVQGGVSRASSSTACPSPPTSSRRPCSWRARGRSSRRATPSWSVPRPGLRRQEAVRRELQRGEPTAFAIGNGAVIEGWVQALVGVTVGTRMVIACRRSSATARRATRTPNQAHRHARVRDRRAGRPEPADRWQSDDQERAAAQPAHHAAGPAAVRRQGPDPRDPLPGLQRGASRRCSSATRTSCAPRRADRGRAVGRRLRRRARLPDQPRTPSPFRRSPWPPTRRPCSGSRPGSGSMPSSPRRRPRRSAS